MTWRLCIAAALLIAASPAWARFDPGFVPYAPIGTPAAQTRDCPKTLAPVTALAADSRYATDDPTRSTVDENRELAYDRAVGPLKTYTRTLVRFANRYTRSKGKNGAAAVCVLGLLDTWAKAAALTRIETTTAEFNRTTALSAIALSYLQVSRAPAPAGTHDRIKGWIGELGRSSRGYYDGLEPRKRLLRGNHRFWAALSGALAGGIIDDQELFDWGMEGYRIGVCAVDARGYLPVEITRGPLALRYHVFATGPLVMLGELARRNGVAIAPECEDGLHRLVAGTLAALDTPAPMALAAGTEQTPAGSNDIERGGDLAWLVLYDRRFADRNPWHDRMKAIAAMSNTNLGGDQRLLFATP